MTRTIGGQTRWGTARWGVDTWAVMTPQSTLMSRLLQDPGVTAGVPLKPGSPFRLVVEMLSPVGANAARWGSAHWGVDHWAETVGDWVDISSRVRGLAWLQGVMQSAQRCEVGTGTCTLNNLDGAVSPWSSSGAFTDGGRSFIRAGLIVRWGVIEEVPAPSIVQKASMSGLTAASTVTSSALPAPATAGNLLVAIHCVNGDGGATPATPAGWALGPTQRNNNSSFRVTVYWKVAAGGETTVAITTAGTPNTQIGLLELHGVDPVNPVGTFTGHSSETSQTMFGAATATDEARRDSIALAMFGVDGLPSGYTFSTGYSGSAGYNGGDTLGVGVKASATPAGESCTGTWGTNLNWVALLVEFQAVASYSPFFTGKVEATPESVSANVDSWVDLTMVELRTDLGNVPPPETVVSGRALTAVIWQVLADADWPYQLSYQAPDEDVDVCSALLQDTSANERLQLVTDSLHWDVCTDGRGQILVFRRHLSDEDVAYTFANKPEDTAGSLPIVGAAPYTNVERVLNSVTGAVVGGVQVQRDDARSQARFGVITTGYGFPHDGLVLIDQTAVAALAERVLSLHAWDDRGIASVQLDADMDEALYGALTDIACNARDGRPYGVVWTHPAGGSLTEVVGVEGQSHGITMEGEQVKWTATLQVGHSGTLSES